MIQSESNPIDTSLVQYENLIPEWRKHVTIEDEIDACYEICDQCFADTVTLLRINSMKYEEWKYF